MSQLQNASICIFSQERNTLNLTWLMRHVLSCVKNDFTVFGL